MDLGSPFFAYKAVCTHWKNLQSIFKLQNNTPPCWFFAYPKRFIVSQHCYVTIMLNKVLMSQSTSKNQININCVNEEPCGKPQGIRQIISIASNPLSVYLVLLYISPRSSRLPSPLQSQHNIHLSKTPHP